MQLRKSTWVVVLALAPLIVHSTSAAEGENVRSSSDLPQQYSATAFGQSGVAAGKSFGLNAYVTKWTDDGQVGEFAATLRNKGPNGLVSALEKTKEVGRLAPTGFVGSAFRIARISPTADGGSHIVMVTNRPMSFYELYNGTRSRDYQFGIVVLDVDKNGKGTGTLAPACKIKFNKKGELEIEHYGQKPLRLANLRRVK